jgi:glutathione S-transferase
MLDVFGRSSSINVRKVLWTCAELEINYRHEQWGAGELSLQDPAFVRLNPNALIPVIRDGEFVLWESNAICRYLAAKAGHTDLLPDQLERRGFVEQWMDWQATELNNAWRYAFMALVRRSPAHADPVAVEASIRSWNRHMAILDAALGRTQAFITGAVFTLADVVLGLSTHRWYMTPMERPSFTAVAAYYERLSQRAGFLAHGRNGLP